MGDPYQTMLMANVTVKTTEMPEQRMTTLSCGTCKMLRKRQDDLRKLTSYCMFSHWNKTGKGRLTERLLCSNNRTHGSYQGRAFWRQPWCSGGYQRHGAPWGYVIHHRSGTSVAILKNHHDVPPWAKAGREVENPILANQGMKYICHKLDHRLVLWIVCWKGQTKVQDRIGIVA